jgi:hypothetical protein
MSIRLLVNSAMTAKNSNGDLIVATLWLNSTANCMLACAISRSCLRQQSAEGYLSGF